MRKPKCCTARSVACRNGIGGPVVLCYLEGLTHEEAARQLGWPMGTLGVRLMRARERLRAD